MPILAFDTAMNACSAAVGEGEKVLASRLEAMRRGQAERLLPMVEEVMAEAVIAYRDLELIAVTVGPGSFTGVRIAVAAARGLSLASHLKVLAFTSLEAIAAAVPPTAQPLMVASDARRGEVYHQSFDLSGPWPRAMGAVRLAALDDIAPDLPPAPFLLAGSGAALVAERADEGEVLDHVPVDPVAANLLAMAAMRAGEAQAGAKIVPLYIREPDAKLPEAVP